MTETSPAKDLETGDSEYGEVFYTIFTVWEKWLTNKKYYATKIIERITGSKNNNKVFFIIRPGGLT